MDRARLTSRVEAIEQRMETWDARFDAIGSQISQLRDEMRIEFSGVREEIHQGDEEVSLSLRETIQASNEETRQVLREEIRAGDEETRRVLRDEIRAGDEETRQVLRDEIRAGDEETRTLMRVLHEDVITRLAMLGDAR